MFDSLILARGNPIRFFNGLSEGDPVAWVILAAVIGFTAFSAWQKHQQTKSNDQPVQY